MKKSGFTLISLLSLRKRSCKQSLRPSGLKGFTLIELLVTISILAILMMIVLISYINVMKNGRDAKRKSDLAMIQSALEQYHADQGYYPSNISLTVRTNGCFISLQNFVITSSNYDLWLKNITGSSVPRPTPEKFYLTKLPTDPKDYCPNNDDASARIYLYAPQPATCDNGNAGFCTSYCIYAKMENSSNESSDSLCSNATLQSYGYKYSVRSP